MVDKKIYIDYREDGVLTQAYEVVLASENNLYGIKIFGSGDVVYANETPVDNPTTGRYEKNLTLAENTVYSVSWRVKPNIGDQPKYVIQQIGPFESTSAARAVADFRGTFIQGTRGTFFLRVTDINGNPREPDPVSCTVYDSDGATIASGTPERAGIGFYAYDWEIGDNQPTGTYSTVWSYRVDGETKVETQEFVVSRRSEANPPSLYAARILEFRTSLSFMITAAMNIPVYREQSKPSADNKTFYFTFSRWNQSPGCSIFVNNEISRTGYTINYFKGTITFDEPLTEYDTVVANYNFRWFSDEELDRFLSNAMHLVNLWPPVSLRVTFFSLTDRLIPLVLYGAAVDAIRNMMMSLMFQEPQMVFGGPDGASKVYGQLESLKKNYEETWNKGLEQKKNGPYVGLTKTLVVPSFALPGGRSRWFRSLFSSGS